MSAPDISAVLTAHREGAIVGMSLRSMVDATMAARAGGLTVELLAVLDVGNAATRQVLDNSSAELRVIACDLRDQGAARNLAAREATGDFVAFLDGDDLWSENWLVAAHAAALAAPAKAVIHPETNWFFGEINNLFFKCGDDDPAFDPEFLRLGNYWDAMAFLPRALLLHMPFSARDLEAGWALEDWNFNCRTVAAGIPHRVAPGTIHFKRRRPGSQHGQAIGAAGLPPPSDLMDYRWHDKG